MITSSSANFSGRLLNLHALATATGDLLSITSTGSGATNRAIAIDLDNGNLDNTVLSIFSDEINTSTTPADTEKFARALTRRLNRVVRLHPSVDPGLIGGAVVRAGDFVLDGSLKGKLERLGQSMAN